MKKPMDPQGRSLMMANDPIPRLIFKMAVPTIVAFLINSIYSLADTYFVSSLGQSATAALNVNASLDQLIMMCGSLLAIGSNSYIARLLGQGNEKKASQVLSTAFFLAFGIGALLTVVGVSFMTPMVRLLGATATSEEYAIDYATYVLLAAPLMASSFVMNQCLRSEGSATLSMLGMGAGGVLNCILDPIFILSKGDPLLGGLMTMPFGLGMGVAGASLATAISKLVSFCILIFPYLTHHSLLRLSIRNFYFSWDIISKIVAVGSSSMFRSGLAVVSAILLNNLAGDIGEAEGLGDALLAGIGVSTKIMMFPFSIILGFGRGFQAGAGFNWGAKRFDRVLGSYRFASFVAIAGSALMAGVLAIYAEPVIALFDSEGGAMLKYGALCIRLQCYALPVHAWVAVVNMLCAGLGRAKGAFLLATSRQGSCFVPILYPLVLAFGAYGIVSVQAIADVLSLVLAIPIAISVTKKVRLAESGQARQNILL